MHTQTHTTQTRTHTHHTYTHIYHTNTHTHHTQTQIPTHTQGLEVAALPEDPRSASSIYFTAQKTPVVIDDQLQII